MLEGTVGAYLTYACAGWAHCLTIKEKNSRVIDQIHRKMLLCYGRLYRTVSYLPGTVICNWAPEKLKIAKRAIIFSHKKHFTLGCKTLY